jgi:hypothetical protein
MTRLTYNTVRDKAKEQNGLNLLVTRENRNEYTESRQRPVVAKRLQSVCLLPYS